MFKRHSANEDVNITLYTLYLPHYVYSAVINDHPYIPQEITGT